MVITYYGASCFRVQSGETVLAFDPPSKDSEFKSPRFQADVVLVNYNHKDYNGWENLSGKKEGALPFLIEGPGAYEVAGIYIKGIPSDLNTIYVLSMENISICHLGAFAEKNLSPDLKEEIGKIDVLFVPLIEDNGQKATQISAQLEPKITIPMHYKEGDLKQFLKEFGDASVKPIEKLTIKKKDIGEKNQVIVLEPCL